MTIERMHPKPTIESREGRWVPAAEVCGDRLEFKEPDGEPGIRELKPELDVGDPLERAALEGSSEYVRMYLISQYALSYLLPGPIILFST